MVLKNHSPSKVFLKMGHIICYIQCDYFHIPGVGRWNSGHVQHAPCIIFHALSCIRSVSIIHAFMYQDRVEAQSWHLSFTCSGNTCSGNTCSGNTCSGNTCSGNTCSGNTLKQVHAGVKLGYMCKVNKELLKTVTIINHARLTVFIFAGTNDSHPIHIIYIITLQDLFLISQPLLQQSKQNIQTFD